MRPAGRTSPTPAVRSAGSSGGHTGWQEWVYSRARGSNSVNNKTRMRCFTGSQLHTHRACPEEGLWLRDERTEAASHPARLPYVPAPMQVPVWSQPGTSSHLLTTHCRAGTLGPAGSQLVPGTRTTSGMVYRPAAAMPGRQPSAPGQPSRRWSPSPPQSRRPSSRTHGPTWQSRALSKWC